MVQHDNKKEAMWREEEKKKRQGQFTLRRLTIPAATSFPGRHIKHASYFKTSSAAVSATWMTERVKAAHTDSQFKKYESQLGKPACINTKHTLTKN